MANKRLSMRKIKEILRLYHEMGLSRRRIAESLQVAHSTVGDVIRRAKCVGLGWPITDTMIWDDVERLLYPGNTNKPKARPMLNWNRFTASSGVGSPLPCSSCGMSTSRRTRMELRKCHRGGAWIQQGQEAYGKKYSCEWIRQILRKLGHSHKRSTKRSTRASKEAQEAFNRGQLS